MRVDLEVRRLTAAAPRVLDFGISHPVDGGVSDSQAIRIAGWVVPRDAPLHGVVVCHQGIGIQQFAVIERMDVAAAVNATHALRSGFDAWLSLVGLPPGGILTLHAEIEGDRGAAFAEIGWRRGSWSAVASRLSPILVSGMGRSGTTALMAMLGAHPAIVGWTRPPHELRIAAYWMSLARMAAQGAGYELGVTPDTFEERFGANPFLHPDYLGHPEHGLTAPALVDAPLEALLPGVARAIDALYLSLAPATGAAPTRFLEKGARVQARRMLLEAYDHGREILLTRDLRDIVASVMAFSAMRGSGGFGREAFASDAQWADGLVVDARRWLDCAREFPGKTLIVRYEDLVLNPPDTLTRILAFLGLPAGDATIGRMTAIFADDARRVGHATAASPLSSIGQWRSKLPTALAARLTAQLDDDLAPFRHE